MSGPARNRKARGYASGKADYIVRLAKIEGQIRGLQKMIEADRRCQDVVTQVASATRALQELAVGLLTDHLASCVNADGGDQVETTDPELYEVAAMLRQIVRL